MSDEEKDDYAINRTLNGHNKHIKHEFTRKENGEYLSEIVDILTQNDIKVYFFITPYTRNYLKYIDSRYKPDILNALNNLKDPVEFLDMNDYSDIFSDEDFIDSDHLNKQGAIKATALLNEYIALAEE